MASKKLWMGLLFDLLISAAKALRESYTGRKDAEQAYKDLIEGGIIIGHQSDDEIRRALEDMPDKE